MLLAEKQSDGTCISKHRWRKLGHVYKPSGKFKWALTHAANPTPEHVSADLYRVYFSTRDAQNRSSIGSVLIDLKKPQEILEEASEPVLAPGELGMFDDSGASIGCILNVEGRRFLYYMGWNLSVTVPWKNAVGLAVSDSLDKPFIRHSTFPVLPLCETDPYTLSYPCVLKENGTFRMWYGSNLKWGPVREDMLHVLKYAESVDGINWQRENKVIVDVHNYPEEFAVCRPTVLKENGKYWMWFCGRGTRKYRIGIATSDDGQTWTRMETDSGIKPSESGWDSEMIEYPHVLKHKDDLYLFYCGSEYGKTGFGLAVLERD